MLKLEKQVNVAEPLTNNDWAALGPLFKTQNLDKGESLIPESELLESVYYIASGSIKIFRKNTKNQNVFFEVLSEKNFFGAEGYFSNTPEEISAFGVEPCTLLKISFRELRELELRNPVLAVKLYKSLAFSLSHQLNQKNETAERLLSLSRLIALGEMTVSIIHEINNPLTTLQLLIHELTEGGDHSNERNNHLVKSIDFNFDHINKLVGAIQLASRKSNSDALQSHLAQNIIENSLQLCQGRLKEAKTKIEIEVLPKQLEMRCRATELVQVLVNLISNAHDAVEDQATGWIKISARASDGEVELAVTDSGPGVPKDLESEIFEPFCSTKAPGEGTGLGLSLSKQLIEAHGGQLFYDNSSACTRFVARLPT